MKPTNMYKESSPYANFITAIFQNIPEIYGLWVFRHYNQKVFLKSWVPFIYRERHDYIRRADASSAIVDLKTHSYESVTIAMSHSLPSVVGLDGAELI